MLFNSPSVHRSILSSVLACCIAGLANPSVCHAQKGEDIAKGLLRALIESQLDKSRRRTDSRDNLRPPNGRGIPIQPQLTRQMQQLRPITASLSQESATLVALVQTDARRNLAARSHLPDAIRLQATASALNQRVNSQYNHILVTDDFRNFNNDWSTLSHHLGECSGLGSQSQACLKRIAALDAQYCSILGIQEQFNSRELVRAAYTLTNYNRDLIDDIKDMYRPGNKHRQLLRDMGRYSQKAEYFANLASQGTTYQTVVSAFQDSFASWTQMEPRLAEYSTHSLVRTMRRIQDSNREIHGLLRLEMGLDRNLVLQLVHTIDHEVTEVFRAITLEELMSLPDGQSVPVAADAVYGTIQNLDDLVHRDQSPQEIGEAWVYADEAWKEFRYYLTNVRNPKAAAGLRSIGDSMKSLKQTLGVTVAYDKDVLVKSASSLEFLTSQLLRAVQKWHRRPGNHDRSLPPRIQQMEASLHHIEQSLISGQPVGSHRGECNQAISLWQQIRPELQKCDTQERPELDHIAGRITAEGIKLHTMLAE